MWASKTGQDVERCESQLSIGTEPAGGSLFLSVPKPLKRWAGRILRGTERRLIVGVLRRKDSL